MEGENGTIKISKQRVIVSPPTGQGQYPQILPAEGLIIHVNGKIISSPTVVTTADEVTITGKEEILEKGTAKVEISTDGLSALLFLAPVLKARFSVQDSREEFILEPAVEREIIKEPAAGLDEVKNLLAAKKITYGINDEVLEKAVSSMTAKGVVIARGKPPVPGEDALVKFYFKHDSFSIDTESINNIDYREKGDILSVDKDTLLAEKIPAQEGSPGISVTGTELHPPPPRDFVFLATSSVYLDEEKLKVYARNTGRPQVEKGPGYYKIRVLALYTLSEDVSLNTGHVRFRGDVQINGRVQESMEVIAGGNLKIYGSVNNAVIRAGGSITIFDNVINSRVEAGARQSFVMKVTPHLLEFEKTLVNILKSYRQIVARPEFSKARFGFILDMLVEKKFTLFPKQLKELYEMLKIQFRGDFSKEMMEAVVPLRKAMEDFQALPYQELPAAVELLRKTTELKNIFQEQPSDKSSINVVYALNSVLEASGSITVEGQGCYHTKIISQDAVIIKGVIRGGTVMAKENVTINKIGSDAAVKTTVIIPEDKTVSMQQVFENTIVQAGNFSYKFTSPQSKVKVFFDKQSLSVKVKNL